MSAQVIPFPGQGGRDDTDTRRKMLLGQFAMLPLADQQEVFARIAAEVETQELLARILALPTPAKRQLLDGWQGHQEGQPGSNVVAFPVSARRRGSAFGGPDGTA